MTLYCTEEDLRFALPLDQQTKPVDFGNLIRDVSDAFDRVLGFGYGGDVRTVKLSGMGCDRLMLPRPGAFANGLSSIYENGVPLAPANYELEPDFGRYVLRLDDTANVTTWREGRRNIQVTYTPRQCPDSLSQRCVVECVRIYRSRQMGHARQIGAPGLSRLEYRDGFEPVTIALLDALKWEAGSGGPGWVVM